MPKETWELPLIWLGIDGLAAPRNATVRHAYLPIEISQDGRSWQQHLAMIDTGATYTIVSANALKGISARRIGTKAMSGNWSNTVSDSYEIFIRAQGMKDFELQTQVTELSMNSGFYDPSVVLGMDYIRMGKLVLNSIEDQAFLQLSEGSLRKASQNNLGVQSTR